jgi:hypothetical protein
MSEDRQANLSNWRGFAALVAAVLALDVFALVRHAEFQPTYLLRTVAPAIALVLAATFTHRVAKRRAQVDVDGEFDPAGRSLFLGFVMVAVAFLAWLLAAHAVPALLNSALGVPRSEPAVVTQKPAATADVDCGHRLVITSASLVRPLDECVAEPLWRAAASGSTVTVDLSASAFGAEAVGLRR